MLTDGFVCKVARSGYGTVRTKNSSSRDDSHKRIFF